MFRLFDFFMSQGFPIDRSRIRIQGGSSSLPLWRSAPTNIEESRAISTAREKGGNIDLEAD